jgi:hypothetical protein
LRRLREYLLPLPVTQFLCTFLSNPYTSIRLRQRLLGTSSKQLTNYEAQRLGLANAVSSRKHVLDLDVLFDVLPARGLPGHKRTRLAGKISLGKDVVREVSQTLALEVR